MPISGFASVRLGLGARAQGRLWTRIVGRRNMGRVGFSLVAQRRIWSRIVGSDRVGFSVGRGDCGPGLLLAASSGVRLVAVRSNRGNLDPRWFAWVLKPSLSDSLSQPALGMLGRSTSNEKMVAFH